MSATLSTKSRTHHESRPGTFGILGAIAFGERNDPEGAGILAYSSSMSESLILEAAILYEDSSNYGPNEPNTRGEIKQTREKIRKAKKRPIKLNDHAYVKPRSFRGGNRAHRLGDLLLLSQNI